MSKPLVDEHGAKILDSDDAKELLPEFNRGAGAGAVYNETLDIHARALSRTKKRR